MVIDEAPDPEAARAEARRIAREWLMFDSEPDIEGFSLAYAGAACSGGCELTRAPVQGVRTLLVFPSLTWREVRAADSMLGRSILLRLEDGRLWSLKVPAMFAIDSDFIARLAARLRPASHDAWRWELLSRRLSAELMRLSVVDARLDDPLAREWELERVSRAICHAAVSKALLWYRAKNTARLHEHFLPFARAGLERALALLLGARATDLAQTARGAEPLTVSLFNYFWCCAPEVSRNRLQAAAVFPIFTPALSRRVRPGDRELIRELGSIIDHGRPFLRDAAAPLGVKAEMLRYIQGKPLALLGEQWAAAPEDLLRALSFVPREQRPREKEEWDRFSKALRTFRTIAGGSGSTVVWQLWLRELARRGFRPGTNALLDELSRPNVARGVADFVSALHEAIANLAFRSLAGKRSSEDRNDLVVTLAHDAIARLSLRGLLELSARWHERMLALQAEVLRSSDAGYRRTWESIVDGAVPVGDLFVHPLLSERALLQEGERLRHCVATYATACWSYRSFIFSVRDRLGNPLSTFEISIDADRRRKSESAQSRYRIVQHSGPDNDEPEPRCVHTAEQFTTLLEKTVPIARLLHLDERRRRRAVALALPDNQAQRASIACEAVRSVLPGTPSLRDLAERLANPPIDGDATRT
jgi:transposase